MWHELLQGHSSGPVRRLGAPSPRAPPLDLVQISLGRHRSLLLPNLRNRQICETGFTGHGAECVLGTQGVTLLSWGLKPLFLSPFCLPGVSRCPKAGVHAAGRGPGGPEQGGISPQQKPVPNSPREIDHRTWLWEGPVSPPRHPPWPSVMTPALSAHSESEQVVDMASWALRAGLLRSSLFVGSEKSPTSESRLAPGAESLVSLWLVSSLTLGLQECRGRRLGLTGWGARETCLLLRAHTTLDRSPAEEGNNHPQEEQPWRPPDAL